MDFPHVLLGCIVPELSSLAWRDLSSLSGTLVAVEGFAPSIFEL